MARYLVDSTVIIDALNQKRGWVDVLKRLVLEGHSVGCCPISITEVYAGMRPQDRERTEELLRSLEFYEITWDIAVRAGLLRRHWATKGVSLSLPDVTIAAVAIEHDLILITDNVKDFPMPEIRLYATA